MNPTELLYMTDMASTEGTATVQGVVDLEGKTTVFLDQTLFYAQGGGQPYDKGTITSDAASFQVEEVRYMEGGAVKHIGHFTAGRFSEGEKVSLHVDPERRTLHRRLHSGGHVVDLALKRLGIDWIPGKGYHFPDGPYVEYEGSLPADKEQLQKTIETECNKIIEENIPTRIEFVSAEEMQKRGFDIPPTLAPGKPLRIVYYGDFGVPCGGTHVDEMGDLRSLSIRKLKQEGSKIRVAYDVER